MPKGEPTLKQRAVAANALLRLRNSKLSMWLKENTESWWDVENYCKRWGCSPHQLRKHLYGEVPLSSLAVYMVWWDAKPRVTMEDIVLEYITRRALKDKTKNLDGLFEIPIRKEKAVGKTKEALKQQASKRSTTKNRSPKKAKRPAHKRTQHVRRVKQGAAKRRG